MTSRLRFGFSPCPNDTHAFFAVSHGLVPIELGGETVELESVLLDIEELNERALGPDPFELTKLSTGVLGAVGDRYRVLPSGAALGRGVGPLVVVREGFPIAVGLESLRGLRVAIPGEHTTANALLRRFGPAFTPVVMRFDRILHATERGEVDAGLIIHESRFTFRDHGLVRLADLGEIWERDRGLPLPLAVIGLHRAVPQRLFWPLSRALSESVRMARSRPRLARSFVRRNAQELDDAVCSQHIALYVNEFSERLGLQGRAALQAFGPSA